MDRVAEYIAERVYGIPSQRCGPLPCTGIDPSHSLGMTQFHAPLRLRSHGPPHRRRGARRFPRGHSRDRGVTPHRAPSRPSRDLHPRRVHPACRSVRARQRGHPEPDRAVLRLLRRSRPAPARLRLAGGGVGDADPRAATSPRVARPGTRARGVRPGGGAELRPAGRRAVRSRSSTSTASPRARAPTGWRTTSSSSASSPSCRRRSGSNGGVGSTGWTVPAETDLPAFLTLDGVTDAPAGELVLVLRRKPGLRDLLRRARSTQATVRAAEVYFSPDSSDFPNS